MTEGIAEVLHRISRIKEFNERVTELQKMGKKYPALIGVLRHGFDKTIKWNLPEGTPPFKKQPKEMDLQGTLHGRIRSFVYFLDGNYPDMKKQKRESIFIGLLETCDPQDADLLVAVKDKVVPSIFYHKRINKKLIQAAWPEAETWW